MRIAIASDIHANLTAFEAVLADIRRASPDLMLHGGDLAGGGSRPAECIDLIRDLGWPGVMGNTDEMLIRPESLDQFAAQSQAPPGLWQAIRQDAAATRDQLGEQRLGWLRELPLAQILPQLAVVHATPASCWRAPAPAAADAELNEIYGPLGRRTIVFGHTHVPEIRAVGGTLRWLINAGSVGMSWDGDPRASWLLLEEGTPQIRRVAYDIERELRSVAASGLPSADWTARILRASRPQLP